MEPLREERALPPIRPKIVSARDDIELFDELCRMVYREAMNSCRHTSRCMRPMTCSAVFRVRKLSIRLNARDEIKRDIITTSLKGVWTSQSLDIEID